MPSGVHVADDITDALERAHAQQRAASVWASGISAQQAGNIAALAKTYPQLKPGVALSLGASGVDPDSPLAQTAAKTATEEHAHKGWLNRIGDVVSGASSPVRASTRTALTVAQAPIEALTGFARTTYGAGQAFADGGVGAADDYLAEHGTLGDLAGRPPSGPPSKPLTRHRRATSATCSASQPGQARRLRPGRRLVPVPHIGRGPAADPERARERPPRRRACVDVRPRVRASPHDATGLDWRLGRALGRTTSCPA
jgi:hypothetical protein